MTNYKKQSRFAPHREIEEQEERRQKQREARRTGDYIALREIQALERTSIRASAGSMAEELRAPRKGDNLRIHRKDIDEVEEAEEEMVGILRGKKLEDITFGRVVNHIGPSYEGRIHSKQDMEIYEIQRDLFWWYCKQDVYHCILSGGALL
jgi:hypothetical protein